MKLTSLKRLFASVVIATATMAAASASYAANPAYFTKYDSVRMSRDAKGVLVIAWQTDGGPMTFRNRDH